jgi:steroid delta-isomerase-like uncharacterized protein
MRRAAPFALSLLALAGCAPERGPMADDKLREFAARYTAAWCSQNAASVAAFFAEDGSLRINQAEPAVGRAAITASAQRFMSAFPDMVVRMTVLTIEGNHAIYHWNLTGTNTGPGGLGHKVNLPGYEEWTIGANGLIKQSLGHYDDLEFQRQLRGGA